MKKEVYNRLYFILIIILLILNTLLFFQRASHPLNFRINNLKPTSRATATGSLRLVVLPSCYINLSSGWNLISLCSNPPNHSVSYVFGNLSYRYIMLWNESSKSFVIYSPRSSNNPFNKLDVNESYFILTDNNDLYGIRGSSNNNMNISLDTGWNNPSYPYIGTANITDCLESVAGEYRYVMKWNPSSQEFMIYSPKAVDKPFTKIYKGEGQFIYAYENALLRYNKSAL